jgi:endonuclease YncB( thermonuclease family)
MHRARHRLALPVLGLLAALLVALVPASSATASAYDRDCGDFSTQRAAQLFFLDNSPRLDPHRLDSDGDLIACETNPCPCLYEKSGGTSSGTTTGPTQLRQRARVVAVLDGDTVRVRLAGGPRRDVRLVGIDTPEVYGGAECGGRQASRSLKQILPRGSKVSLVSDPSQALKDRYGRLLRYVHKVSTGRDVNRQQVYRGWARVYVYNDKPFNRVTSYRTAQRAADVANRGLWGRC